MADNDAQQEKPIFKIEPLPPAVDGKEIYRFLTTQYLYQNQLSWSRLQTIFFIEAGLLAWFFSKSASVPIVVIGMILGSITIWLLLQLVIRDWEVRDQNTHLLDEVHKAVGVKLIKEACREWLRGRYVVAYLTYGSIIVNLSLSILSLHNVAQPCVR